VSRRSLGLRAEDAVAIHLEAQGYRLLGRNVRLGPLEIDLVAQQGDLVILVEVRTRGPRAFETPFGSVTMKKRETLLRAAERWAKEHKDEGWSRLRIDVAAVRFDAAGASSIEYDAGAITAS
jgi:putative endonuclease